jgi:hypothetical protein
MNLPFRRIVAVFLLPVLLVDPALAAAFQPVHLSARSVSLKKPVIFDQMALSAAASFFTWPSLQRPVSSTVFDSLDRVGEKIDDFFGLGEIRNPESWHPLKTKKSLWLQFIALPATLIHELGHLSAMLLTLNLPTEFVIFPRKTENGWITDPHVTGSRRITAWEGLYTYPMGWVFEIALAAVSLAALVVVAFDGNLAMGTRIGVGLLGIVGAISEAAFDYRRDQMMAENTGPRIITLDEVLGRPRREMSDAEGFEWARRNWRKSLDLRNGGGPGSPAYFGALPPNDLPATTALVQHMQDVRAGQISDPTYALARALVLYLRAMPEQVVRVSPAAPFNNLHLAADGLMRIPEIASGRIIQSHLTLTAPVRGQATYELRAGPATDDAIRIQVDGDDLILLWGSYNTRFPARFLPIYYPVLQVLMREIRSVPVAATPRSAPSAQTRQPPDLSTFYADQSYDEMASTLIQQWPGFSMAAFPERISKSDLLVNTYPFEDAKSGDRRIFRLAFPLPVSGQSGQGETITRNGLRITRLNAPGPEVPTLAILFNNRTGDVERIAVHLYNEQYDGMFVEMTPSMSGFEAVKSALEERLRRPYRTRSNPQQHFTWPFIEGDGSGFEQVVASNAHLLYVAMQIRRYPMIDRKPYLNRGFWVAYDMSQSHQTTGGSFMMRQAGRQTLGSIGHITFQPREYRTLFHEWLHTLFHLKLASRELRESQLQGLLAHIRRAHPRFEPFLLSQLAYRQQGEGAPALSLITEWISWTGQGIFERGTTWGSMPIRSPWGNDVTMTDRHLLQELGFLPAERSLDMTWLLHGIEFVLEKLGVGISRREVIRRTLISFIEPGLLLLANAVGSFLGQPELAILGSAVLFGIAHTGRSGRFKVAAGLWAAAAMTFLQSGSLEHYLAVAAAQLAYNLMEYAGLFRSVPNGRPFFKHVRSFLHSA